MNVEKEKCVIVVDENLPLGIIANTVAILGITMGMKMPDVVGNLDLEKISRMLHLNVEALTIFSSLFVHDF